MEPIIYTLPACAKQPYLSVSATPASRHWMGSHYLHLFLSHVLPPISIHSSLLTTSLYLPLFPPIPSPPFSPPSPLQPPAARILCLAIIYTHPADLLHLSFSSSTSHSASASLSHPPPIEPAISCMATSPRKRARWHSTGSGPTSTCRSYCPSSRQQQGDDIKSWIICDQTRIQSVAESLKIRKIN